HGLLRGLRRTDRRTRVSPRRPRHRARRVLRNARPPRRDPPSRKPRASHLPEGLIPSFISETKMRLQQALLASVIAGVAGHAAASCGAAFCLVNTDWSVQGSWTEPGGRFDLRYESIDLDQPRSGRDKVSVGQIPRHHDEVETINKNLVGTFDWNFSSQWGLSVAVPYVDREHTHVHDHRGEKLVEQWDFRELADVRVMGRYEFASTSPDPATAAFTGLTFGLKLPTGKY